MDVDQIVTPIAVSGAILIFAMWMLRVYSDRFHRALASACCFTSYMILAGFIFYQHVELTTAFSGSQQPESAHRKFGTDEFGQKLELASR
jgi:hypothetical protein